MKLVKTNSAYTRNTKEKLTKNDKKGWNRKTTGRV